MNKKKVLTISVAAYNLGDMIRENIESFIKMKNKGKVELLIINDGSTDNTKEIVEEYQNKYHEIVKLINQANAGPGSTVNTGIRNATGKYFKMVDGDDWINSDDLDLLITKLDHTNADMILTNFSFFNDSKKCFTKTFKVQNLENEKIYKIDDINYDMDYRMHNIMYRTEILQNNKITLDNGFYTDTEYVNFPLPYIKSVQYFDLNIYMYRIGQANQSVSIPKMIEKIDQHLEITENLISYYEENKEKNNPNSNKIMVNKISMVAINHLETILLLKMDRENINKVKSYLKSIEGKSIDIYQEMKKAKKVKTLLLSNYLLIRLVARVNKKLVLAREKEG